MLIDYKTWRLNVLEYGSDLSDQLRWFKYVWMDPNIKHVNLAPVFFFDKFLEEWAYSIQKTNDIYIPFHYNILMTNFLDHLGNTSTIN